MQDADDEDEDAAGQGAAGSGRRLAMLLTQQLFDERYNDPAVKRLLLAKRSLDVDPASGQASGQASGHTMRRRKKSTRSDTQVQRDLAHIFGEPEPPRALPLAAADTPAASTATPSPAPAKEGNTSDQSEQTP